MDNEFAEDSDRVCMELVAVESDEILDVETGSTVIFQPLKYCDKDVHPVDNTIAIKAVIPVYLVTLETLTLFFILVSLPLFN